MRRLSTAGPLAADSPFRAAARATRLGQSIARGIGEGGAARELAELGLERILGNSDLMSVSFLEGGFLAARSVSRIKLRSAGGTVLGYGTGFLISSRILMTNHHVLGSAEQAGSSTAEFDFRDSARGRSLLSSEFRLRPDLFFLTDSSFDCTLVGIADAAMDGTGSLASFGWNRLIPGEGKVAVGEKLNIIQHPGGQPQQVALRANELRDVLDNYLHYSTDTAPGSSGSPVFNDQWEVLALHHSGVPKRDSAGRILADDGTVWREAMGEHRINWISNEGVRISKILGWLAGQPIKDNWLDLRNEILASPVPSVEALQHTNSTTAMIPNNSTTFTIPLQITVSLGAASGAVANVQETPAAVPRASVDGLPPHADMTLALTRLREHETDTYFDEASDAVDVESYYRGVVWSQAPEDLFNTLSGLLKESHHTKPRYKPAIELYPWIDLHPDRKIRSIYSDEAHAPDEFIRKDLEVDVARGARISEKMSSESFSSADLQDELALVEAALPYNCEHSVPQSTFGKQEPMRGDLHHLFACESECNSFRGNIPYFDFDAAEEVVREKCGRRESDKFDPAAGHGAVARATLYFLLRYPGLIGDRSAELPASRLPVLLRWHRDNPPGAYEKHRNQTIFAKQGNRNPLIDFPEIAEKVAFQRGFGSF